MDVRPADPPTAGIDVLSQRAWAVSTALVLAAVLLLTVLPQGPSEAAAAPSATPTATCDAGSRPEKVQGHVPPEDFETGRAREGYYCNARVVSHLPSSGGFRVERYADQTGHVCAFYDSTRMLPLELPTQLQSEGAGVYVVDMTRPEKPVVTATLTTPAMLAPHESLRLNQRRGLLVAAAGTLLTAPGVVDVYDVSVDCRQPQLRSSTPLGILGHEGGFAPDGRTYYVTGLDYITAIDLTNPLVPRILWVGTSWTPHGVSVSNDGRTLYLTEIEERRGLTILDVSQIQARAADPQVKEVSRLTWREASIPQNATPFVSKGRRYLIETDEFGGGSGGQPVDSPVGAARIIDVQDPRRPHVVSRLRLQSNDMPGIKTGAHYCSLPSRLDPYIVACAFFESGLRVFDIRDVHKPREVAYTNFVYPRSAYSSATGNQIDKEPGHAYAAPAYDPENLSIWYTDAIRGFYAVRLTPGSGVTRFARAYHLPGS